MNGWRSLALCCALLLTACDRAPAEIPEGCYRFADGEPFFRMVGHKGVFVSTAGLRSFEIGPWMNAERSEIRTMPAFLLHDGTAGPPPGPARMAQEVPARPSGTLGYRHEGGRDILVVPIEAYGEVDVVRGPPC